MNKTLDPAFEIGLHGNHEPVVADGEFGSFAPTLLNRVSEDGLHRFAQVCTLLLLLLALWALAAARGAQREQNIAQAQLTT